MTEKAEQGIPFKDYDPYQERFANYDKIRTDLARLETTEETFKGQLSETINYQGRSWTYGQFLYKYFFDQHQILIKLLGYDENNPEEQKEIQELIDLYRLNDYGDIEEQLNFLREKKEALDRWKGKNIPNAKNEMEAIYSTLQGTSQSLAFFRNASKEDQKQINKENQERINFYRNLLFEGKNDDQHFLHPVFSIYTSFIEDRLAKMGFSAQQIDWFMEHCREEQKKAEVFLGEKTQNMFIFTYLLKQNNLN